MTIYIPSDQAIEIYRKTVAKSGGGSYDIINVGYLESALQHIQNDDYCPTFEEKLIHVIWSINKNHSFRMEINDCRLLWVCSFYR